MLVAGRAFFLIIPGFCLLCHTAGVPGAACALLGRAACCAGGRRPAREIATREPSARSGRSRGPPWPRRHPRAPQPGPPIPPAPSTPVTPVADMRLGASSRSPARPRHRPRTPQPGLPTSGPPHAKPSLPSLLRPHPISHVIHQGLLQVLNSDRWNCNVFRVH